METKKEYNPPWAFYEICAYCKNVREVSEFNPDDVNLACSVNLTNSGLLRRIGVTPYLEQVGGEKAIIDGSIDGYKGCEQFLSTGLPAHPLVLEEMVKVNPTCATIPSDPNITEMDSWIFTRKSEKYLYESIKGDYRINPEKVEPMKDTLIKSDIQKD